MAGGARKVPRQAEVVIFFLVICPIYDTQFGKFVGFLGKTHAEQKLSKLDIDKLCPNSYNKMYNIWWKKVAYP